MYYFMPIFQIITKVDLIPAFEMSTALITFNGNKDKYYNTLVN